jgi:hypothetical protein
MLIAALAAALMLWTPQQAAGTIVWETPSAAAPAAEAEETPPPATSSLPDWALADPFAWERSQCSPMIRKDASMADCQVRVRSELAAALGDSLPTGLAPDGIEDCRQVSDGVGGYALTCAPAQRTSTSAAAPVAEVCEERPTRVPGGGVSFERQCRPATAPQTRNGVTFKLGGD